MDYKAKFISLINDESLPIEQRKKLEEIYNSCIESENERIRKGILALVRQSSEVLDKQNQNNMITWLEKQGQKPTLSERYKNIAQSEWFKRTHEGMSCGMVTPEESLGISSEKYNEIVNECIFGEESKKWTKEDESKVYDIIYFLNTAKTHYASTEALDDCIEWIKLLKQRILQQ